MKTFLKYIEDAPKNKYGHKMAVYKCKCGSVVVREVTLIKNDRLMSCGCYRIERKNTHGLSRDRKGNVTKIYRAWINMKSRCYDTNNSRYDNYGGRGIVVCEEWKESVNFFEWASKSGYKRGLQLDRIDVNGNYEPNNCRWVAPKVNANNRRNTVYYTLNGIKKSLSEWSDGTGLPMQTISARIEHYGWSVERALTTKPLIKRHRGAMKYRLLEYRGEAKPLNVWAKELGIKPSTLRARILSMGWDIDSALNAPINKKYRNNRVKS